MIKLQKSHAPAESLICLVNLSDMKQDEELRQPEIKEIAGKCIGCKRHKQTPTYPVVALPLSSEFNAMLAMDMKFYQGTQILIWIDTCT